MLLILKFIEWYIIFFLLENLYLEVKCFFILLYLFNLYYSGLFEVFIVKIGFLFNLSLIVNLLLLINFCNIGIDIILVIIL